MELRYFFLSSSDTSKKVGSEAWNNATTVDNPWLRPSKPLFSSTNSLKSPLKIDLKPKTTFVAEIGNFCCFLATRTLKFPDRNFWHWDPPGAEKTRLFRKKVDFFDLTEYSALFEGGAQWQKFLPDPQFFDFYHFSAFL